MKFAFVLFALFALVNASLVKLDGNNFDDVVGQDLPVFIKFFAPWCGHCKHLAPTWEQLADIFTEKDGVIIAEVDADGEKDLAQRFGIQGYPTLKYFPKNEADKPIDYNQGREINDLVKFVNEQTGLHKVVKEPFNPVTILTPDNFQSTIDNKPFVFIKFYAPWCGHCKALAPKWIELAKVFSEEADVVIAELDADKYHDIGQKFGVTGFPTIKFFKNGEVIDYNGARDVDALVEFVNTNAGTQRNVDGSIKPEYGVVEEFDEIIKSFPDITEKHLEQAKEIASNLEGKAKEFGKIYVALIKKIVANGAAYVDKEKTRVGKLIQSDSINSLKKASFRIRQNILNKF
ncbi:hypothetical protein WA158_002857 [Blastocystis sp. Blastoise]